MKKNALRTLSLFFLLSFSSAVFCQGGTVFEPELALADNRNPAKKVAPAASSARSHKRFPQLFTGMAIEIATSTYPMDKANPMFRQFGNVFYQKLPEGGYSYLIMTNFSSIEAALEFAQSVVKPKAENARLIQFNEGNRKVIRE